MTDPTPVSAAYWRGVRQGLPFVLVIVPFGLLFGVAGSEAGMSLFEVLGFSVLVIAGAWLGKAIPAEFALDFAVPVTFLAMIAPMLRSVPHVVAAGVSVAMALALSFLPSGTGLMLAAALAMAAGAQTELWLARRAAR